MLGRNENRRVRQTPGIFFCATALLCAGPVAFAQGGPQGITAPIVLPQYQADAASCSAPPGLNRKLVFAQDNERQFMQGVARGLSLATKDRDLAFEIMLAANDPKKMIEQVQAALAQKVGALVAAPVHPPSLAPNLQQMVWAGAYVGTVVPPPAITILNAPQYQTGKVLAEAAASYIRTRLKGKANVVLLTHDSLQFLSPRFAAMRDVLFELPGVTIVADISPTTVNKEGGLEMMRKILLAHPDVDVVLGADTVVLGALQALREAKKARPDQFLGGIDGEPEAVAELKSSNSPYKASVALSSPVFGYALGYYAADWLQGKSVPQAMDILPSLLTRDNIAQYEADFENPGTVFNDPKRRNAYLKMYGNICYDTRDRYLNFPWSSERK